MFAHFGSEDVELCDDAYLVKLFRLSQLTMEFLYVMYTASQQLSQQLVDKLKSQSAALETAQAKTLQVKKELAETRRSLKQKTKQGMMYEAVLRWNGAQGGGG